MSVSSSGENLLDPVTLREARWDGFRVYVVLAVSDPSARFSNISQHSLITQVVEYMQFKMPQPHLCLDSESRWDQRVAVFDPIMLTVPKWFDTTEFIPLSTATVYG